MGTMKELLMEKAEVLISDNVKVEVVKSTGIQALVNSQEVKK